MVCRQTPRNDFLDSGTVLSEDERDPIEPVDCLLDSTVSDCDAVIGRTKSSAGIGGTEPLMAVIGFPGVDVALYSGTLVQSIYQPLLQSFLPFLFSCAPGIYSVEAQPECGRQLRALQRRAEDNSVASPSVAIRLPGTHTTYFRS